MADPMAAVMTQRLAEDAMRVTSAAETMRVSSLPEILSGSSWPEMWGRHPYIDPVLSGVARLRDDHRTLMELQHVLSGHFTGVADLEKALGPMMPERTFLGCSPEEIDSFGRPHTQDHPRWWPGPRDPQ